MSSDDLINDLVADVHFTGDLVTDVTRLLVRHGCDATVTHMRAVAAESRQLALAWVLGDGVTDAVTAAWLHDVSAVIPNADRVRVSEMWGIPVLPEERRAPVLLHQQLSAYLARVLFNVADPAILDAVACHTTLRAGATLLDKVVFLADKIAWDQPGVPPYLPDLQRALAQSLDGAVCVYLDHLWQQRAQLLAVHPWLVEAHRELCAAPEAS